MAGVFGGGRDFFVKGQVILEDKASKVIDAVQNKMGTMGRKAMVLGSRIRSTGQSMTIGLTAPIIGLGVAIVKTAGQFGDEMAKIIGLSAASAKQVGLWREEVLELAVAMGKSPQELAEGLFFLASAGLKAGTEMEVLRITAKASVAGLGEVKIIANVLANVIAAYGQENIDAADAVGVLVAAVRTGNLEADQMAEVFGRLLPLAVELGISFPELAASLSSLSRINADASENASAFLGVMKSFAVETPQAERALSEVGLSFDDLRQSLRERGLIATLIDLRERLGGIGDVQAVFPRIRGLTGLLNLTGAQAEAVNEIFQDLSSAGAKDLEFAFDAMQTPAQNMRVIMVRVQVALIRLEPVISVIADVLSGMVTFLEKGTNAFAAMPGPIQKAAVVFALLLALLGPLLIVIGALISAFGSVVVVIQPLIVSIRALGLSVRVALGVIGLLLAATTAIATGLFFLVKWFRRGSDEAEEFDEKLRQIAETAEILGLDPVVDVAKDLAVQWIANQKAMTPLLTSLEELDAQFGGIPIRAGTVRREFLLLQEQIGELQGANKGLIERMEATGIELDQATIVADDLGVSMGTLTSLWPEFGRAADKAGVNVDDLADTLETTEEKTLDWKEAVEGVAKALNTDLTDAIRGITDIETIEEVQLQSLISATELQIETIRKEADFLDDNLTPAQQSEIDVLEDTVTALQGTKDWYDKTQGAQGDLLATLITGLPTQAEVTRLYEVMAGRLSDVDRAAFFAEVAAGNLDQALENMSTVDPTLADDIRRVLSKPLQEALAIAKQVADLFRNFPSIQTLPGVIGLPPSDLFQDFAHGTQFVPKTGLARLHAGEVVLRPGQTTRATSGDTFNMNITLGGRATREDAEELVDMVEKIQRGRRLRFQ